MPSLLPPEGFYRLQKTLDKFLYARGFNPTLLRKPPYPPKDTILVYKDGKRFKTVSSSQQKEFIRNYFFLDNPPNFLVAVGAATQDTALTSLTHLAAKRAKKLGLESGIYCVSCSLDKEDILYVVEDPRFLVIYDVSLNPDLATFLLHHYVNALRLAVAPVETPVKYVKEVLKVDPDFLITF